MLGLFPLASRAIFISPYPNSADALKLVDESCLRELLLPEVRTYESSSSLIVISLVRLEPLLVRSLGSLYDDFARLICKVSELIFYPRFLRIRGYYSI